MFFLYSFFVDHLQVAETLANVLDNQFGVGKLRFGLTGIFDLIPGFGDIIAAGLSFYIVWIAIKMEVKPAAISQMVTNILLVFLVGSVPVIGDLVYVLAKVNTRNVKILKENMPAEVIEGKIIS